MGLITNGAVCLVFQADEWFHIPLLILTIVFANKWDEGRDSGRVDKMRVLENFPRSVYRIQGLRLVRAHALNRGSYRMANS